MAADPGKLGHRRNCTRPDPQVSVNARGTRHSCPSCRRYTFTPAEAPQPLTTAQARTLAAELIGDLTPHAGDPDAVRATLLAWLDREDTFRLSLVCMAVVQTTFADCLTRVPVDQISAGVLTLTQPTEGETT